MNTADYLLQGADSSTAVLTSGAHYSYRDLKNAAARTLAGLIDVGVAPGDRVGILGENSIFWIASYLAILKRGAVAVPLPTVSTPDDLRRKEQVVRCRAICIQSRLARRFGLALRAGLTVITDEVLARPDDGCWEPRQESFDYGQDAALMLTSGTTALPRAVRITHRNIQANTESIIRSLDLAREDRMLVVIPFYYCFGTSLLHTHLRAGGSLALCNTFAYPETALDMIEAAQATAIAGVPSTFQTLLRNSSLRGSKLASLKKVQQAGGKLQPVLLRELMSALPRVRIYTMYGQTEATARLSCLQPEYLESKLGSIGRGIPGVTLKVVDESGVEVAPGQVGEIVATGDNVSPGYFEDPDASAAKFAGGLLRSGDLATVDSDGFIYIVDRKADFIKSLGHRVSSQEVEAHVLEQAPEVVTAAAVGQPDPVNGEAIIVFVTLRTGAETTPDEILRRCRATMARHMAPKEIVVVDSLPMNAHGKVIKTALRRQAASGVPSILPGPDPASVLFQANR
jgi:acyl-CoA synthetase (AMP-forming)/AMP-acid ligase II